MPTRDAGEALAWLAVFGWAVLIFLIVPLARALQRWVAEAFGREAFSLVVLAVLVICLVAAATQLWRRPGKSWKNLAWLLLVGAVIAGLTMSLRANPEEAIHFIQYGVLGILSFRALSYRIRDPSIYLAAAGVTVIVGILDEGLQWATRERIWDLRDIYINLSAGALALLGLAKGLEPRHIRGPVQPRGVRLTCRIWSGVVLLLLLSLLNTPERINAYVSRLPSLDFLITNASVMAEYGYLYRDPDAGVFRSRFAPRELAAVDAARAEEAARLLDAAVHERKAFGEFLRIYSPLTDPFLHEARVHLYRRENYLQRAGRVGESHPFHDSHMAIAHHQNQILERYFGETLRRSRYVMEPELRARLQRYALGEYEYESPVSKQLITRLDEADVAALLVAALIALLVVERRYGRD